MEHPGLSTREHNDEADDELPMLRAQDLAEECVKHLALRPRGRDELDDHEHAEDDDTHEDAEHGTDDEADDPEPTEFDLALTRDTLWDMEG